LADLQAISRVDAFNDRDIQKHPETRQDKAAVSARRL
jgi:hypothetical protein